MSMVTFKHYCRICNKGFSCGPALGGHMRAHGIVNVNEDYADRVDHPAKRTMYGLRSNSNRVCDNCGRDFPTMESFINHGKCDSDDEEQELFVEERWLLFSSPKRFKSSSSNLIRSTEDEDLAKCLMLLSSSSTTVDSREESCESASKSKSPAYSPVPILKAYSNSINNVSNNNSLIFECKACKKVFSSHQALGGHRASHKKVKGCFASKLDQVEEEEEEEEVEEVEEEEAPINESTSNLVIQGVEAELEKNNTKKKKKKKKAKVHECSICQRQFGSGQALGGHKRCHWITSNLNSNPRPNPTHSAMPRVIRSNNEDELTLRLDLNVAVATSSSINYGGDHGKMVNMTTNGRGCNLSGVVEGEVEGMVKLAKLSELKDVINGGGGGGGDVAPWLQVGIGSTGFERSM